MKEKSEMQSHLAANMCKIDSESENVLNTLSPGRTSRWILPEELETPNRPTSSGLQSPAGAPVQFGPSPQTREYILDILHVSLHQLNGEMYMVEQAMKNVSYSMECF